MKEEEYISSYINTNENWINYPVSLPAAIFGPFYLIYRKEYTRGIVFILLFIVSHAYLPENVGLTLRIISNLFLSITHNRNYKSYVYSNVEKIKQENPKMSHKELIRECKKKGGTLNILVMTIILILYIMGIYVLIKPNNNQTINNLIKNHELSYEVPSNIKKLENQTNYQYFVDKKENGTCYITINSQYYPNTKKDYLVNILKEETRYQEIKREEKEFNHINYLYSYLQNSSKEKEIFITISKKQRIYSITFESTNNSSCKKDIEKIMKTTTIS